MIVSLDAFTADDSIHLLLFGSNDKVIEQLNVIPNFCNRKMGKSRLVYDCIWDHNRPKIAALYEDKEIEILHGKNFKGFKLKYEGEAVTQIALSPNGKYIAYGLKDGSIYYLELGDNKETNVSSSQEILDCGNVMIGKLSSEVTHLKYFQKNSDSILLAGSANGRIYVFVKHICVNRFLMCDQSSIVFSSYLSNTGKILIITKLRTVIVYGEEGYFKQILFENRNRTPEANAAIVTSASISNDEKILAITLSDGSFEVYELKFHNDTVTAMQLMTLNRYIVPVSCAISYENETLDDSRSVVDTQRENGRDHFKQAGKRFVAIGRINGHIEVGIIEISVK